MSSGLTDQTAKFMTIGIGAIMVVMTIVIMPLMDRMGRRTLHLYGLGGMFIFSIFITISFLIKVRWSLFNLYFKDNKIRLLQKLFSVLKLIV